jgi:signal transduction histidine kinase
MGLAICQKIVERHGGTISVESVVGRGTRFTVIFPAGRANGRENVPLENAVS